MNIDFFSIPSFDRAFILARKSNKTLPGSVRDNLSSEEEIRLLEIIEGFEKSPTDLKAKEEKYPELMKLFYKGVGLNEKGEGTISQTNQRAAFELSALINDSILQDQQNIRSDYGSSELKKALELQNQFRKALEGTNFKQLLSAQGSSYTELSEGQKEYQTEKITSYLAENKKDFQDIFEKLSASNYDQLTLEQKKQLDNLKTLAGKSQNILNALLSTFEEFKEYRFTSTDLALMNKDSRRELSKQAVPENISPNDNWERLITSDRDNSDRSSRSTRESREISRLNRLCERLLARLEENDPSNNTGNRGNRWNNNSNNCNCANCNGGNNCNCNNGNNGNNGNNDIPSWVRDIGFGLNLAGQFLTITGLGNNNQNGGRYPPPTPIPYYVGGDTWPWGRTNGINGDEYSASNNYMPSSVSSNPYSTASAYNPVNVTVNPVFNNNPYMASNSSALSSAPSSNSYELRRVFDIC